MTDTDEHVVAAVDDERRNLDTRENIAHVEREDSGELGASDTRRRTEALNPRPPLDDTRSVNDRRTESMSMDAGAPLPFERVEIRLVHVVRQPGGVVVCSGEPRIPVDDHERLDPFGMRHCGHQSRLRPEAVGDEACTLEARRVHDRDEIVHPALDRTPFAHGIGHADAARSEPEHAGEACERRKPIRDEGLLDERLEVARPVEHDDDAVGAVAKDLVCDVGVARASVLRRGERHWR